MNSQPSRTSLDINLTNGGTLHLEITFNGGKFSGRGTVTRLNRTIVTRILRGFGTTQQDVVDDLVSQANIAAIEP
jgi:hypothetical protein